MKRSFAHWAAWTALLAALSLLVIPALVAAAPPPTVRATVEVHIADAAGGETFLFGGLDALFHQSEQNVWLNFTQQQPAEVSLTGPGRVQVVDGRVQASGLLSIELGPGSALRIDLEQLDGEDDNPFEIGAGGGCLVNLTGLLSSPDNPAGAPIDMHFHFVTHDSATSPTFRVAAAAMLADETVVFGGLDALFHQSEHNVWLNFSNRQPVGAEVIGPAWVQVVDGRVHAKGLVIIDLTATEQLLIDLGQLDGADANPFEIGPGGGCLMNLTGSVSTAGRPVIMLVEMHFHFVALNSAS
ncbi:MAG TPA: hypothetical protein VFU22_24970 [Roseiflexaceae bacterium]|nr:hypothetical protein [Roseiflexaceae bacterium]